VEHGRSRPPIERTFTSVREALPAASFEAFDAELQAITPPPVVAPGSLDGLNAGYYVHFDEPRLVVEVIQDLVDRSTP
jgi:hypothetical protein